jgi:TPR repeat protein
LLLGLCYETGVGVPGNLYQAAALYQQAAEKGIAEAQQLLGRCYEEGRGVFKDSEMAQYWQSKFSLNKGGLLRD